MTTTIASSLCLIASLAVAAPDPDPIVLRGRLTVHPEFERFVKPGGSLHLRLMSLRLRRPHTFKVYRDVRFPLDYEIRVSELVSHRSIDRLKQNDFYLEAFYAGAGKDLYKGRDGQVGGEAWGRAGKPYPLEFGAQADLVLASFWTQALVSGSLTTPKGTLAGGWLDVVSELRDRVKPRNRLTVAILQPGDPKPAFAKVLAAKRYENVPVDRLPVAFHLFDQDYRVRPIDKSWNGLYFARLESFDERGALLSSLDGLRASDQVQISAFISDLRIVLIYDTADSPYKDLKLDFDIAASPLTFD